jgi:hypothetical protein
VRVVEPLLTMPDNALSSVPDSPQGATQPTAQPTGHDGAGAEANVKDAGFTARILRASAGAVDQHLSEAPRKRGQSIKPGVPLESVGAGTDEARLEEGTPAPLGGVVAAVPAFDEETTRKVVQIGIDLLNDGAAAIVRAVAKKETGDVTHAEEAAQSVRMSEKYRDTIEFGAIACARKYAVNMAYAPEMMLGGGLVLWLGQISLVIRAEKLKGAEIRARAKEERKAA